MEIITVIYIYWRG